MIEPTHEEWLAARERVDQATGLPPDDLTEAALGPCPPEPAPEPLRKDCFMLVETCEGVIRARELALTPDEADAMACSLIEHAAYAREQTPEPSVCGWPVADEDVEGDEKRCQRPVGHGGFCLPRRLIQDDWRSHEEAAASDVCGHLTRDAARCLRPKGHAGVCRPHPLADDDDA